MPKAICGSVGTVCPALGGQVRGASEVPSSSLRLAVFLWDPCWDWSPCRPGLLPPGRDSALAVRHAQAAAMMGTQWGGGSRNRAGSRRGIRSVVHSDHPCFLKKLCILLQIGIQTRSELANPPPRVQSLSTYSQRLLTPGKGREAQVRGIPRRSGAWAGGRAVTLWSATPRYPSSGLGLAGAPGPGWGLLSTAGCALPVAGCCCCCGGRSFRPPRLLYTSNKLVHMVVSAKHTARPWRCGRAGENREGS